MQGNTVEDLDVGTVLDDQALDDVEAVQFDLGSGEVGQIPAGGRRGSAGSLAAVQCAAAAQDAVDGSHRWHPGDPLRQQLLADGVGTDGPQVAVGQFAPCHENQILQGDIGAAGLVRGVRAVGPIDVIEALALGTLDPVRNRGDADSELTGDGTQGPATADSGYHGPATLDLTLCLLMGFPPDGSVFGGIIALGCSGSIGTKLFGIYWHLPG